MIDQAPKLCRDCRHHISRKDPRAPGRRAIDRLLGRKGPPQTGKWYSKCGHKLPDDPATLLRIDFWGSLMLQFCDTRRNDKLLCGWDARYFEPRYRG